MFKLNMNLLNTLYHELIKRKFGLEMELINTKKNA